MDEAPVACGGMAVDFGDIDRHLGTLSESQRLLALAGLTARFSAGFLRWMRSQAGETLPYSGVRVLEILESQGPTIMRDIAGPLDMTARNMTAIVDTLEETGLVTRVPHPHDRRATVVQLTDEGCTAAASARNAAADWVAQAFNSMTLDEQQQYAALLRRLARFFCTRP